MQQKDTVVISNGQTTTEGTTGKTESKYVPGGPKDRIPFGKIVSILSLVLLLGGVAGGVYLSQQKTNTQQNASFVLSQGVYDSCAPYDASCQADLQRFYSDGLRLVINYAQLYGSQQGELDYAQAAYTHGMKIIWNLKDNVNTNLCAKYTGLFSSCTSNASFIAQFVDLTKNLPATWGYYTDDEQGVNAINTLQSVYQTIKAHTTKPVLIVEAYWSVSAVNANFPRLCNTADVFAVDYYPVGNPSGYTDINQVYPIGRALNEQAYLCHKATAMVLQAHSWAEYGHPGAPYPSLGQEQSMITQAMNALVTPDTILWYSYFKNPSGVNPTWPQPVAAIGLYPAPNTLPPVPTAVPTTVPTATPTSAPSCKPTSLNYSGFCGGQNSTTCGGDETGKVSGVTLSWQGCEGVSSYDVTYLTDAKTVSATSVRLPTVDCEVVNGTGQNEGFSAQYQNTPVSFTVCNHGTTNCTTSTFIPPVCPVTAPTTPVSPTQVPTAIPSGVPTQPVDTTTPTSATPLVGDINHDGVVNVIDYSILAGCYGLSVGQSSASCADPSVADLNGDGVVDGIDYNIFIRALIADSTSQ